MAVAIYKSHLLPHVAEFFPHFVHFLNDVLSLGCKKCLNCEAKGVLSV